jgi:hypothetical protein
MDHGLWASWYDLPASEHDAYLDWLHGTYIPRVLSMPGILWAAHYQFDRDKPVNEPAVARMLSHTADDTVPTGSDYLLMFGAGSAYDFARGKDAYMHHAGGRFEADLTEHDRQMLALRIGERSSIMAEVARRDGPDANKREGPYVLSPCIQLGTFNVAAPAIEEELLAWFAGWRFDALGNLPGSMRIRHFLSLTGWAKHGILYEFPSREARDAHFPHLRKIYPEEGAWTNRLLPKLMHAPDSPIVGLRLWPPIKS